MRDGRGRRASCRRGYLAKIFNDEWMASFGYLSTPGETLVGEVMRRKSGDLPQLVHGHPSETVRQAINILREYGVSQMPIVRSPRVARMTVARTGNVTASRDWRAL